MPNQDQVLSAVRTFLAIIGTVMINHGWVNDATWSLVVGFIVAIVPLVWGIAVQSTSSKVGSVSSMAGATIVVDKNHPGVSSVLVAAAADTSQPNVVFKKAA